MVGAGFGNRGGVGHQGVPLSLRGRVFFFFFPFLSQVSCMNHSAGDSYFLGLQRENGREEVERESIFTSNLESLCKRL